MRTAAALLFLMTSFVLAAENSSRRLEQVQLFGSSYVRLNEWCDSAGFSIRWIKKEEQLQVTNKFWKFSFAVDSRKAQVNGMNFMLSLPIALRSGVPFISSADLQALIHPILSPPRNPAGSRMKTICLDAGHGGKDPGNIEKWIQEKKYTLMLAGELARVLKQSGFNVILTRNTDKFIDLSERANIANRARADLFISLHYNGASSAEVRGAEVYCLSPAGTSSSNVGAGKGDTGSLPGNSNDPKNVVLAFQVQRALLKNLGAEDRGVKRARFEVLRHARMPAILVESGFMSNPQELKTIMDTAHRKRTALAIADGILAYKRIVER